MAAYDLFSLHLAERERMIREIESRRRAEERPHPDAARRQSVERVPRGLLHRLLPRRI